VSDHFGFYEGKILGFTQYLTCHVVQPITHNSFVYSPHD